MEFWVHVAARKHPGRAAIETPERTLSYAELSRLAVEGARALQSRGVRGADRVALEIDDRVDFLIALHACLLLGAPAVPIDLRLSESERELRRREAVITIQEPLGPADGVLWRSTAPPNVAFATVMHTSGTTSEPKPVELSYANW